MNKKIVNFLLLAIVVIAAALRLWQLGLVPPSPDWDEVALGYDAYSIMTTGRDEFGKFLPVVLRSFDDYKPALYAYFTIPSIILFGLTTFAVRFPSAIFGVIAVIAVFFLIRELFEKYKYRDSLALVSSLIFAISPWSIQFSRVAFESHVGVCFNILCALFFVKGLKKPWLLSVSALFAALGPYIYQSERVFSPLLVLILIAVFAKNLIRLPKKYLIAAFATGIIVIFPMAHNLLTDKSALLRLKGTSFFSYQTELLSDDIRKLERDRAGGNIIGEVFDNRRVVYAKTVAAGYLSHFDLNWLFLRGDISRHHAPFMGLIYLVELPLILIGIYVLLFGKFNPQTKFLIFLWFLAAPIPASITTGVPHAVRTLNFLPTWQIFSALGVITSFIFISNIKYAILKVRLNYLIFGFAGLVSFFNFAYYLNQYFVQQNYYFSHEWQYGYEQAIAKVKEIGGHYDKIVVSDTTPMDKSYMFFLFYLKYPPTDYQKIGATSSGSFVSHHYFDKYEFRPINWPEDSKMKNVLFIGPPFELPSSQGLIQTIRNLDGREAIRIVGT
jgi:4-amino-4-deoxy-L-arabinose transferase-like glycosyltransferase